MAGVLRLLSWIGLGLAGVALMLLAWSRVFPLFPDNLEVRRAEAVLLAEEAFEELTETPDGGRYRVELIFDTSLERRLLRGLSRRQLDQVRHEILGSRWVAWRVELEVDGRAEFRAMVGLDGEIHRVQVPLAETGSPLTDRRAARRAVAFLERRGIDLGAYDSPYVQRQTRLSKRQEVRFPHLGSVARLDGFDHGMMVRFDGSRISGWGHWVLDAEHQVNRIQTVAWTYWQILRCVVVVLLFLVLMTLWFRFYDAGRMRLRRSLHVAELVVAAGIPWLALSVRELGAASSAQKALWIVGWVFFVVFMGFLAFLTSGVGEALARDRWHHRLAAFEAVLQGDWQNNTVARACLHGLTIGALGAGVALCLSLPLSWFGITPLVGPVIDGALVGGAPGFGWIFQEIFLLWVPLLLNFLVVVPFLMKRLGPRFGFFASLLATAVLIPPPFQLAPAWLALFWNLALAALPLVLFLTSDLLAALLSVFVMRLLITLYPLVLAADGWFQLGGWLTLGAIAAPALFALRGLHSERSFTYGYDAGTEIPLDVLAKVADRERRLLELETAKEVQAAILPRTPPEMDGLDIAHAYLPASEIGGDFYDLYALDESRVAFALGDVAGHGIASGLVMSTVRGALRAHFQIEPDVRRVFSSINQMLVDLGDRRLLTTLVYGVFDSRTGRLTFAASGHVVWRTDPLSPLKSWAPKVYPLGARPGMEVEVVEEILAPGQSLVLISDGLIEAVGGADDEPYGFERIERSLELLRLRDATDIVAGLLDHIATHLGGRRPDDDCTVLVLQADETKTLSSMPADQPSKSS